VKGVKGSEYLTIEAEQGSPLWVGHFKGERLSSESEEALMSWKEQLHTWMELDDNRPPWRRLRRRLRREPESVDYR
jgi:hypothetical protein